MNFALDLLDSVAEESPADLLPIVRESAKMGDHLVVKRWVEVQNDRRNQGLSVDMGINDAVFTKAMLQMTSLADKPSVLVKTEKSSLKQHPCVESFSTWAKVAHEGNDQRENILSDMLLQCVQSSMPRLVCAGSELLKLGVSPLHPLRSGDQDIPLDLPGVKWGLQEKGTTLLSRAIACQHPLTAELVAQSRTAKAPWPTVAQVGVDGQFHDVNAAGYALALGDIKMLREVCKNTRGDAHKIASGLAQAVEFALGSGLVQKCTPELAQGIAICVSLGADLDHARIGIRLTTERMSLAEEVSGHQHMGAIDYRIPALFMAPNTGTESLAAISRLVSDCGMNLDGSVTQAGHGASLLHYAAASGHVDLVNGLLKLGADPDAIDAKGLQPKHWAYVFDRAQVQSLLGSEMPVAPITAGQETIAPAVEGGLVPDNWDPEGAQNWNPADETWHDNDSQNVFEEEAYSTSVQSNDDARSDQALKTPATPVESEIPLRDRVASSANEAQASKGSALLSWLQSAQASAAARVRPLEDRVSVEQAASVENATPSKRMNFKSRP